MTYPTTKPDFRQAGVSLLLAVLVLAAITAIAFSLASIIAIEIRASGDVLRTEPALYAVQGVTEETFFKYGRAVPTSNPATLTDFDIVNCTPSSLNVCSLNNVVIGQASLTPSNCTTNFVAGQCNPVIRNFDNGPRVDTIAPGKTMIYLLVDPTAPQSFAQAYSQFKATYLNNGVSANVSVDVYSYDSAGNKTTVLSNSILNQANSPATININSGGQYEVDLRNTSTTDNVLIQVDAIKTTAVNGKTDLIPLVGQQVLDITAVYSGLTRKYTVSVPGG